ncbi:MAG: hypothetical protein GQ574_24180, partial [Crocinitomix sp.]|nr:hypothetical protein [Crocinitomix sp.]
DKEEPKHYDFYGYIYYSVTSSHKIVKFDEASLEVLNLKANKGMLAYDVLNAGQLKKYLNADW